MSAKDSTRSSQILKRHSLKIGDQFDRLTISGPPEDRRNSRGDWIAHYPCRCRCGVERIVPYGALVKGNTKSCGCRQRDVVGARYRTHGETESRLYSIWRNMISRCENPNAAEYKNYGSRGILLCDEWRASFVVFRDWARANGYADDLTIERKDVNGNYEPANCTWIPLSKQGENTRKTLFLTAFGETKPAKRWSEDPRCVVSSYTLTDRFHKGWDHLKAITTPPLNNNAKKPSKASV